MVPPGPEAQATAGPWYICNIELISERDVVNTRSRSLYVIVRPSICLSVYMCICRILLIQLLGCHIEINALSFLVLSCLSSVCNVRASYSGD